MRIVVFVGSPISVEEKEMVKLAKKLKKEKVCVDIVSLGEEVCIVLLTIFPKLKLNCINFLTSIMF